MHLLGMSNNRFSRLSPLTSAAISLLIHLCRMSLLFPPNLLHTSDPRSVMPKPNLPRKPSQPTKTAPKHPIRPTKSPIKALTLPEIPVIIADAGFPSGEMAEWLKALVLKVLAEPTNPANTGLPPMFDIGVLLFGGLS